MQVSLQKNLADTEVKKNAAYAEKRLSILLKDISPESTIYPQISILSVHAAELANLPENAFQHYVVQLNNKGINANIKAATASRLLKLFISVHQDDLLLNLAEVTTNSKLSNNAEISLGCISQLLESSRSKQVVPLCLKLCEFNNLNRSELFALLEIINHKSMVPHKELLLPATLPLVEKYLPQYKDVDQPVYLKLLYSAAVIANNCQQYEKAYEFLNTSLAQKQAYMYFESKIMHAEIAEKLDKATEAEKDCREIMVTSSKPELTIKAVLLLSKIYHKQNQWDKLTATASFCLPMVSSKQKDLPEVQQCLELLCEGMQKFEDKNKLKDVLMLYLKTYPDGDKVPQFSKILKSLP